MPNHKVPPNLWNKLKPIAREMRHEPTPTEATIWTHLREHQEPRFRFRRQHPVGPFIVDFYCSAAKVAIEIDGEIHQYTQEEDALRQAYIEELGITVIRFTTAQVVANPRQVVSEIVRICKEAIG